MSLHPNIDPGLGAALLASPVPLADMSTVRQEDLPDIRAQMNAMRAAMAPVALDERVTIEDRMVPGPEGEPDIRLRIYRRAGQEGAVPGLYWIHGGGMIIGDPEMDDQRMVEYVVQLGCVAVSVDYRLAPEHPHPAPVEDCYAGLVWTAKNAAELGIDPDRLAVGGLSAGGGLAAGTVLLARDRGGPALAFQLLVCPMLDDRNITPSSQEFAEAVVWNRGANLFGWTALLGDAAGSDDVSPYAAPARATDLSGLPPAYIDVGELEVFRDECIDYARRLVQAGVSTEFHLYPGAFHGFDGMIPEAEISRRAAAERVVALRRALLR
ncbi:alpha/beta hydrolase [Streptosporangium subroseum]|nr:alpha/beta hydrolase [Streptosporangium subroseum]